MPKKSVCTINTDAGFYHHLKVGSFAYWIKADNLFLRGSGILKGTTKDSLEAEMKAIINAMHILLASGYSGARLLVINRDNMAAVSNKNGVNELQRMLAKQIRDFRAKCGFRGATPFFEFRHVKAHSHTNSKRNWVNDWCDKRCKAELKEYAKNLKAKDMAGTEAPLKLKSA